MEAVVQVKNLKKTYKGGITAIDDVSFNIQKGEIFGFLGPNGAGKTTTIKILTTLLRPTSGQAIVAGYDISKNSNKVRENIGIVFQEPALDDRLTGKENLDFHARLYGMNKAERKQRISEVLELVGLTQRADSLVKTYSGGMQRRLELARGLMHKPTVLFLDEPTLGLDVQTRRKIWDYILRVKDTENMTILLTTHYMEEAEKVCERIAIIDAGKILKIGTTAELIGTSCGTVLEVKTADKIKNISGVKQIKKNGERVDLVVKDEKQTTKIVKELMNNYDIIELNIRKASLEDVFVQMTGKSIREEKPQKMRARIPRGHGR
ncbi:MAG: ABC transporter ATP-binding protein [Candidatus Altiarchaeota archaeon]|nr:ABC transporter ATP-binding protein [Candidatus Altiarchaeota archaeon]